MSISSFLGLQTSLRGLQAHQQALDVTAHNVSNASTEGYSRQGATLEATAPLQATLLGGGATGLIPQGVDVHAIARMRDTFADLQYRAQSMALGQHTATAESLGQAEQALAEPSDNGLNQVLAKFWSAWHDLANHPENAATRQSLVNQAQLLTDRINALSTQLGAIATDTASQYAQITGPNGDVLSAATEIAQLNGAIKTAVSAGAQPNDLLDRRDRALDRLSALAQVSVTNLGNGAIRVNLGDAAQPLVDDATVSWPQTLTAPGGKLGALLTLSNPTTGTIAGYTAALDAFAGQLASAVNGAYGGTFFSGTTASTLSVAVTAATVKASNQPGPPTGANDVALAVAALRGGAADTAYANLVARIGGDAKDANTQQATAQALAGQAEDRRQSTAGVSMDEEMSNMVRFQRGYQASARAMSTMDEMLDTLINRTGRVGL